MITKLLFLLSESFRALFRAKLPAAISSITIAIALVIFSLAYFSYVNLLGYSYKFTSKYRIEVFFHNDLATDDARELFNTILILDGIEQGEFIDTVAYLQVKDLSTTDNNQVFLFNGWTFASSPTLQSIDHPVYDLWITSCENI